MNRDQVENISRAAASWYAAGDHRIVCRVLGEAKLVVDDRDYSLTPHLVMDGFWESWITVWALRQVNAESRVLNIGANCGYYAILFAKRRAKAVVAVEPQPHLAECIRLSAALNGMQDIVRVVEAVAGCETTTRRLQLFEHMSGSAHIVDDVPADGRLLRHNSIEVKELPAHELMPDANCVFIDAEGFEPYIWEGLSPLLDAKQLDWIALEWAPSRYKDPYAFLDRLAAYGELKIVDHQGREMPVRKNALLSDTGDWDTVVVRRTHPALR